MRNLVVCCDGTWNDENNRDRGQPAPTNIRKIYQMVSGNKHAQVEQICHYQAGVGTGGWFDKFKGGALGIGISEDICESYLWLCQHYQAADHLFLFGFSRGAYCARSLAGMIGRFGLLNVGEAEGIERIKELYQKGYRSQSASTSDMEKLGFSFKPESKQIHFIGVFDTVGALGIPNDKSLLNLFDNRLRYQFHDVSLGESVHNARHAIALDEKRGSFTPTLWGGKNNHRLVQKWFSGVHADIGGGYAETGLSDCTLSWMLQEATSKGLEVEPNLLAQVQPNASGVLHRSHVGWMKALRTCPRATPKLDDADLISPTVEQRIKNLPIDQAFYRPVRSFENGKITLKVRSDIRWNWTGVYLDSDKAYKFTAKGVWYDRNIKCNPSGCAEKTMSKRNLFQKFGRAVGSLERTLNGWFSKSSPIFQKSDFYFTKRVEVFDWFALVGAIPKPLNPDKDGSFAVPETVYLGEKLESFSPQYSGYLYCFANDSWSFYHNNRGEVALTIEEVEKH